MENANLPIDTCNSNFNHSTWVRPIQKCLTTTVKSLITSKSQTPKTSKAKSKQFYSESLLSSKSLKCFCSYTELTTKR